MNVGAALEIARSLKHGPLPKPCDPVPLIGEAEVRAAVQDFLSMAMGCAVPLRIMRLREKGGPSAQDMRKAGESADMLGEHGDVLLHGGGRPGQCADLFNRTAHAVAVLAFCQGGVDLFGQHFEARGTSIPAG